jgi:hypothetical protein
MAANKLGCENEGVWELYCVVAESLGLRDRGNIDEHFMVQILNIGLLIHLG